MEENKEKNDNVMITLTDEALKVGGKVPRETQGQLSQ